MILELFDSFSTHSANSNITLIEVRETLQQRLHARRSEKDNHVVVKLFIIANHVAHSAIHYRLGELDAAILGDVKLLVVNVANWVEISFLVVLGKQWQQRLGMTSLGIENLALAIDDVLLQIVGNRLADAKILHGIRDIKPQLLAKPKVMVNGSACGENYRSVIVDGNFRLTKFS